MNIVTCLPELGSTVLIQESTGGSQLENMSVPLYYQIVAIFTGPLDPLGELRYNTHRPVALRRQIHDCREECFKVDRSFYLFVSLGNLLPFPELEIYQKILRATHSFERKMTTNKTHAQTKPTVRAYVHKPNTIVTVYNI